MIVTQEMRDIAAEVVGDIQPIRQVRNILRLMDPRFLAVGTELPELEEGSRHLIDQEVTEVMLPALLMTGLAMVGTVTDPALKALLTKGMGSVSGVFDTPLREMAGLTALHYELYVDLTNGSIKLQRLSNQEGTRCLVEQYRAASRDQSDLEGSLPHLTQGLKFNTVMMLVEICLKEAGSLTNQFSEWLLDQDHISSEEMVGWLDLAPRRDDIKFVVKIDSPIYPRKLQVTLGSLEDAALERRKVGIEGMDGAPVFYGDDFLVASAIKLLILQKKLNGEEPIPDITVGYDAELRHVAFELSE